MKKPLTLLLLVLFAAATMTAATFPLTLTAGQVSDIQYGYSVASDKGSYPDAQTWFAGQLNGLIAQYHYAQLASTAAQFCAAFKAQSVATQNAICSGAGLANGCNPCVQ